MECGVNGMKETFWDQRSERLIYVITVEKLKLGMICVYARFHPNPVISFFSDTL